MLAQAGTLLAVVCRQPVAGPGTQPRAVCAPQINEMLWALRAPMFGLAAELPGSVPPLMVDIGANVGWFTLNAAAAGARVAAFEGGMLGGGASVLPDHASSKCMGCAAGSCLLPCFRAWWRITVPLPPSATPPTHPPTPAPLRPAAGMPSNIQLIRTSLCHSPWLMERTALYATGLGDQDAQCYVVAGGWGSSSARAGDSAAGVMCWIAVHRRALQTWCALGVRG